MSAQPSQPGLAGMPPAPHERSAEQIETDAMLWAAIIGTLNANARVFTPSAERIFVLCTLQQHHHGHKGAVPLVCYLPCQSVPEAEAHAERLRLGTTVVVHGTGLLATTHAGAPALRMLRTHSVVPVQDLEAQMQPQHPSAAAAQAARAEATATTP